MITDSCNDFLPLPETMALINKLLQKLNILACSKQGTRNTDFRFM